MNFLTTPYDGIETIEIPIENTAQRTFYLPVNEKLEGKTIIRIDILASVSSITPSNRSVISNTNIAHGYFTFKDKQKAKWYNYPLFYMFNNATVKNQTREFSNFKIINWEESFITFNNSASFSSNQSIFLVVHYLNKRRLFKNYLLNPLYKLRLGLYPLRIDEIKARVTQTNQLNYTFDFPEKYNNIKLKKIEFYAASSLTVDGETIINSSTIYNKSYLVLFAKNNKEILWKVPLSFLTKEINQYSEIYLNNLEIDWYKSYVEVANNSSLSADTLFYFFLFY